MTRSTLPTSCCSVRMSSMVVLAAFIVLLKSTHCTPTMLRCADIFSIVSSSSYLRRTTDMRSTHRDIDIQILHTNISHIVVVRRRHIGKRIPRPMQKIAVNWSIKWCIKKQFTCTSMDHTVSTPAGCQRRFP